MHISRTAYIVFGILFCVIFVSCKTTKFVKDGEYLLNKVTINSELKDVSEDELDEYLRQTPNSSVLWLYKMQLHIYNLSPRDTSSSLRRFFHRTFNRIGEEPVIYDPILTKFSAQQLQQVFVNRGFVNARVDTLLFFKGKKVKVKYVIVSNKPYKIKNYVPITGFAVLDSIAADKSKTLVRSETNFDVDMLNKERERITAQMRNLGYFNFTKEFLVFSADSSLKSHQINVKLDLRTNLKRATPARTWPIFNQYKVGKVYFVLNRAEFSDSVDVNELDTVQLGGNCLIDIKNEFISLDALIHNSYIEPNSIFNDLAVEKTYSALNSLPPIKYVNITFKESDDSQVLDSYVYIIPAKTVGVSTEAKVTLTKGYWGGELQLGVVNKNTFGGAETFSTQIRVASEKQDDVWANEYGLQLRLMFPKFIFPFGSYEFKRRIHANTEFTNNSTFQNRPNEFSTTNFTGGMNYTWTAGRYQHKFELINLSYVYFPSIDSTFRANYITPGFYNRYNYEDHLIMRMAYNLNYTNRNPNRPLRSYIAQSYNFESAGNSLFLANKLFKSKKEADGYYKLFNVRYAQYVRSEYNSSFYQIFDKSNRVVYHLGLGLGVPFGNADLIPYERRFYSGGANSVRGWGESRLGPGIYKSIRTDGARDYNQVGDIKLDMNIEYRTKLFWLLEGALFMDAGNVWTIKDYAKEQPGGQFKLNSFAEQIAMAYGAGARLDFSFFLIRFDFGVKLFDPSRDGSDQWRLKPTWRNDLAFHLAIGYPF